MGVMSVIIYLFKTFSNSLEKVWQVSVVRRFGGEPQLMYNGNRHQIHWTSISIGHQLRVHRQIVALRFCPVKTF